MGSFPKICCFVKLCHYIYGAKDIFKCLDTIFNKDLIPWKMCAKICTDGTATNIGMNSGVKKHVQDKAPEVNGCIIFCIDKHWLKKMLELHDTLNAAIKCMNYIKATFLNQRLFSCLCNKMGSDHTGLPLHSEVHWLSQRQINKSTKDFQINKFKSNVEMKVVEK